ncbi:hypothetical protein A6770_06680 [Nostoc minutum NIES-26]|uniref:Oligosaccharide repeat unit polymerase n=1 Tax=Nostoc minutum NIES-26 TaxID=1844469 RepID=A0A367Q4L2_9NOSO|nr:hypothetical protein A6770_06680 [Nostoc minutum NIES-26]
MIEIYRDLLIVTCIGLLSWGIIRIERIYQYPFFMGSMFTSFILPQAFALIDQPGILTPKAVENVLFVSFLCAAACWIGYASKPNRKWLAKLNIVIDERKLFQAGIALMIQGLFFNFLLSRTTLQLAETGGTWQGPSTIYLFFSQVINIAFGLFLLQSLKHPKIINLICTAISGWPLLSTVLGGRRQPMMTLIVIIGFSLWLVYRFLPPRLVIIAAIFLMTVLLPVFGAIRGDFWNLVLTGNWEKVFSLVQDVFETQQKGEILELRNAAVFIDASDKTGMYGYGTGWWDSIVFQYVPGQIVGYDFKRSLQFNLITQETLEKLYGYTIPNGSTTTGIGDSFTEFSYLGCLTFAMIGYIFKHLWISAVYQKSIFSMLLYMGLISPAMVGLTHGIGRFVQEAIFQVSFVILVAYYSRAKYKSQYI